MRVTRTIRFTLTDWYYGGVRRIRITAKLSYHLALMYAVIAEKILERERERAGVRTIGNISPRHSA